MTMPDGMLIGLAVLALAGCEAPAPAAPEAPAAPAVPVAETAPPPAAPADPVAAVIERAEMCMHWGGEEPYDAERRVQINQGVEDAGCDTIVADGDALKTTHPADAARIDAALVDFRP